MWWCDDVDAHSRVSGACLLSLCDTVVKPCRCSHQLPGPAAPDEKGQAKSIQSLPGADNETGV